MKHPVTLIPGDGIGPEIMRSARQVIEAAGVEIEWHEHEAGAHAIERYGTQVPEHVLNCIRADKVCLKGPVTTPIGTGFMSANVILRKSLDLYANLRPARSLPGVKSRFQNVDLVVVRENTEGLYSGHRARGGAGRGGEPENRDGARLDADRRVRLRLRAEERPKLVTAVHKANIMKLSDGMLLAARARSRREYP